MNVLTTYIRSGGVGYFIVAMLFFVLFIASMVGTDLWLGAWGNDAQMNITMAKELSTYRLGGYACFVLCQGSVYESLI